MTRPDLAELHALVQKCPKCAGSGIGDYVDHGSAQHGQEAIEPIRCDTCEGFGRRVIHAGKFSVLVVDPPWSYGSDTGRTRTAEKHYRTMGHEGKEVNRNSGKGIETIITNTPVCDFASDNAHLYLWTTNPKLPFAFDVMRAWGFTYKTTLTWIKTRADGGIHGGGMGWFFRGATEHVLFGVRGNKPIPSALRRPNVFLAETGEHSEKPREFYELLRGIYPADEQMIDMYARKQHERFQAWGDQAP